MNFKQKIQNYFPNLTLLTFDKRKIFYGKTTTVYITYILTGFTKPEVYFAIYKYRTFYIIHWRGLKDSIVVKFEDSNKIFEILNKFINNISSQ